MCSESRGNCDLGRLQNSINGVKYEAKMMLSFVSVLYFDPFSNMIASDTENLKFQGGQVHLNK